MTIDDALTPQHESEQIFLPFWREIQKLNPQFGGFGRNVALVTALRYFQLTMFLPLNVEHVYVTSHGDSWPQGLNIKVDIGVTGHF